MELEAIEGLAPVWGSAFLSDRPLETLEKRGVAVGDELRRKLEAPQAKRASAEARAQLLERLRALGVSRADFKVNPLARVPKSTELPEGEYDLIVGLRLELANQILAGLYETRAWSRELPPTDAQVLFRLNELRQFSDDIPTVEGLEVGALHLTAAPEAAAGPEGRVVLSQPFVLDLDVVGDARETVTTMAGTFKPVVQPVARPDEESPDVLLIETGVPGGQDLPASELEIDPESPVQPRNADALEVLETEVMFSVNLALLKDGRLSISPSITVPLGPAGSEAVLRLQRADVRTSRSPEPGALSIGVLIGTEVEADPDAGSPAILRQAPFLSESVNVSARVHEALLNKLAKEAVRSGAIKLPDLGPEDFELDLELNDIDIDLRPLNSVEITVDAKVVDACGPGPFNFNDLDFKLTAAAQVAVFDETLRVIAPEEVDINYDNTDQLICAISSGIDAATVVWAIEGIFTIAALIIANLAAGGFKDPAELQERGVFVTDEPIPLTELAPTVELLQVLVEEETLELSGNMTLNRDEEHTFVYAKVVGQSLQPFRLGPPIKGADVEVVDQDVPQLLGGELLPTLGTTTTTQGVFEVTRTVELLLPRKNEVLAKGTTEEDGLVRFVLNRRSVGGEIRTTTVRERTDVPEPTPERTVSTVPLVETRPDVFFRVTHPDGRVFDSREPGGGLFFAINLNDRRIGSPESPLLLSLATGIAEPEPAEPIT